MPPWQFGFMYIEDSVRAVLLMMPSEIVPHVIVRVVVPSSCGEVKMNGREGAPHEGMATIIAAASCAATAATPTARMDTIVSRALVRLEILNIILEY
jgi:hypothetical protein